MSKTKSNPYLRGIIDTFLGVKLLLQSNIPHRNRLAVILLDSAFETACRAYLTYISNVKLSENHKHRDALIKTVKAKLTQIDEDVWNNIDYYYTEIRCDFYHQSAGKTITDVTLLDYQDTIEFVVNEAFNVKINQLVETELALLKKENTESEADLTSGYIPLRKLKETLDKIIITVNIIKPKTYDELNSFFKKEGDSLRLEKKDFINIVARNSGSKKYFYYDKELKIWDLSSIGKFKLSQLSGGNDNGK